MPLDYTLMDYDIWTIRMTTFGLLGHLLDIWIFGLHPSDLFECIVGTIIYLREFCRSFDKSSKNYKYKNKQM